MADDEKTEVRTDLANWAIAILDAYVQGSPRKTHRNGLINEIICQWAKETMHVSSMVANRAKEYGGK